MQRRRPKIPLSKVQSRMGRFWERYSDRYRGWYTVIGDSTSYETIDILSDYFLEGPRVRSMGYGERDSPMDHWRQPRLHPRWLPTLFQDPEQRVLTCRTLREWLYARGTPRIVEARQGRPSLYMTMFQLLKPKCVCLGGGGGGAAVLLEVPGPEFKPHCALGQRDRRRRQKPSSRGCRMG